MSGDRAFWSDDFDMDLPKVIPQARAIVGDLADVVLWTTGHRTFGALNSPTAWNTDRGLAAFFGFTCPIMPPGFVTFDSPVQCTFWEAIRDCWPHTFLMTVERTPIWDSQPLRPKFDAIMWHLRGWGEDTPKRARQAQRARTVVERSLAEACDAFRDLLPRHLGRIRRLPSATPPLVTAGDAA